MSRTYAFSTPTRRSRRLLKNGYYRVEHGEHDSLLDLPASEDDDTASFDSNVSKASDQRNISYKESPQPHVFSRRRHWHSPKQISNSLLEIPLQRVAYNTVSYSESQLHDLTHSKYSVRLHSNQETAEISSESNNFNSSDLPKASVSSSSSHTKRGRGRPRDRVLPEVQKGADGDASFKVPMQKTSVNLSKSRLKMQDDQSHDYTLSDEDFAASETKANADQAENENANEKWYLFLQSLTLIYKSYFVGLIWHSGRTFYQIITKILVFDTWFLSASIKFGSFLRRYLKFAIAFLFICICIFLLLSGMPLLLASLKETRQEITHKPEDSVIVTVESGEDIKKVQQNIKMLETSLRALESSFSQRHNSISDAVGIIQKSSDENEEKYSRTQKEMISTLESVTAKLVQAEISKVSAKFEGKIESFQLELQEIRLSHTKNIDYLRRLNEKYELERKSQEPDFMRLNAVEKRLLLVETRIKSLQEEYNDFKTSVNRYSGNVTYLRQLSNEQFLANFEAILEESDDLEREQTGEKRRHNYLARIFVMWLERKGFVEKSALEKIRSEINANSTRIETYFRNALETSIAELKATFFEEIHKTTIEFASLQQQNTQYQQQHHGSSEITEILVKSWIKEALNIYSADRIGEADFALESAGGSVVNTRCSETYYHKTALVSLLGIPIYYNVNTPRSVIQPSVLPGECWAFKGSKGYLVIRLSSAMRPTGFTIDHIPVALSLTKNISSAPKDFSVYGLKDDSDTDGILLGTYMYDKDRESVQSFAVKSNATEIENGFGHIELRITSNWGHPVFTCVYRFRVHGESLK